MKGYYVVMCKLTGCLFGDGFDDVPSFSTRENPVEELHHFIRKRNKNGALIRDKQVVNNLLHSLKLT